MVASFTALQLFSAYNFGEGSKINLRKCIIRTLAIYRYTQITRYTSS